MSSAVRCWLHITPLSAGCKVAPPVPADVKARPRTIPATPQVPQTQVTCMQCVESFLSPSAFPSSSPYPMAFEEADGVASVLCNKPHGQGAQPPLRSDSFFGACSLCAWPFAIAFKSAAFLRDLGFCQPLATDDTGT